MLKIDSKYNYKLNTDHPPEKQPDQTFRYGLNGVIEKGNLTAITSEKGDNIKYELQGNILGVIPINGVDSLYFTDQNNIYKNDNLLLHFDKFDFKKEITGQYRSVRGCEDTVYWNEEDNPDRFINLSNLDVHRNNANVWDIDTFLFAPCVETPTIKTKVLTSGGLLDEGAYYFMVEYLDANQNVIYKSPVSIDYTPVKKNSSSSIEIKLTNVDSSYVRLTVLRFLNSTTTYDAHTIGRIIPVQNKEVTYLYSGLNVGAGDVLISPNLLPLTPYNRSYISTQVQKRLLRANLVENNYDYSDYQRSASKIRTRYVIKKLPKTDGYERTLRGGQVYSLAINYIHKDGTISPAFPLVNRSKRTIDETLISTSIPTEETFSYTFKDFILFGDNRKIRCNYSFSDYPESYELKLSAYNFSNNLISVVQSNPDQTVVQWDFDEQINRNFLIKLEIIVNGTTIEEIDIAALFEIIQGQPVYNGTVSYSETIEYEKWKVQSTSSSTQTVETLNTYIDSGLCGYYETNQKYVNPDFYSCKDEDYWGYDFEGNELKDKNVRHFVMPEFQLYDETHVYPKGLYFDKVEYPNDRIVSHFFSISCLDEVNSNIQDKGLLFPFGAVGSVDEGRYLHNVDGNTYPQPTSKFNFVSPKFLIGNQVSSAQYIVEEATITETVSEINESYGNIFNSSLPYDTLELYQKDHNLQTFIQGDDAIVPITDSKKLLTRSKFEDDENLSHTNNFNILETTLPFDIAGNRYIKYVALKNIQTVFPNIFAIQYRRLTETNNNVSFNGDHFLTRFDFSNISWVNVARRNALQVIIFDDTTVKVEFEIFRNVYVESEINTSLRSQGDVPCDYYYDSTIEPFEFIKNRVIEPDGTRNRMRDSVCKFWKGYNNGLSTIQNLNKWVTLPPSWNFCSECNGEYPNRIIYSEQSFNEDLSDNYRVFKPNNYIDLPSDSGAIRGIDFKDNKLIVRTEHSCYFISPNPQQLQTNESTVFIGTGDFLSIPEQELNTTVTSYGGQLDKMDSIVTEHGLTWVDKIRGKIFNLGANLDILSNNGLSGWFQNNINDEKLRLGYDTENERLLLTHRDFTISYSFLVNGWIHYHSYIPSFYGYSNESLLSINDNIVYEHNNDQRIFRGIESPFIIEYTVSDKYTFKPDSIHYYTDEIDITFDQVIAYNRNQSTGLITLKYLEDEEASVFEKNYVIRTNREFKISPLCDSSNGDNLFIYNNANSIDKVSNVTIKDEVLQGELRGKHVTIRLFLNDPSKKVSFFYLDTLKHYMIR